MRLTYEQSFQVLVLDKWIMSDTVKAMSDAEKLMRIFCSGWNTQLWTYQEGSLPKSISFKFKDEIYDLNEAFLRIRNSQDWSFNYTLREALITQYDNLRGFRIQVLDQAERIKHLIHALAFRPTSVASDETLCLSALMDFDIMDIINVKDPDPNMPAKLAEARMTKFWSLFDRVPAAIYKFDGPTLLGDGYGWALSSMLLSKDPPFEEFNSFLTPSGEPASRTNRGLEVRLPGLKFHINVPLGLEFYVEDEQDQFYQFYFKLPRFIDQVQEYVHNHSGNHQAELCIHPQQISGNNTLAFIFDSFIEFGNEALAKSSQISETGIIVILNRNQTDGKLDAKKIGFAARKTLKALQYTDAKILRDYIHKSSQNLHDYENHNLKYPAKDNGTLLCAKGQKVPV